MADKVMRGTGPQDGAGGRSPPLYDLIELFFFAYRDFTADADRQLDGFGFGRAHHRVLHFVDRHPGLTVATLLDILKITKQSLNRVMKDLIDGAFIEVRTGTRDRRRRTLRVTSKGGELAVDLARLHSSRFERALSPLPAEVRDQVAQFLLGMIDADERERVVGLVFGDTPDAGRTGRDSGSDPTPSPAASPHFPAGQGRAA